MRRARDEEEKKQAEFWLDVRPGGTRSPIQEGDFLTFMSDKEIHRMTVDDRPDRERRLGFWAEGELTSVFQPLSALVGKSARRPDAAATFAAKATGSH